MTIAMGFDWPLAFLTPVLTLSFLGTKAPRPAFKSLVGFVLVVAVASAVGLLVGLLVAFPVVYLLVLALLLFHLFYAKAGGANALLITWMLIAVLLFPILGSLSGALASTVATYMVLGVAVAVATAWIAHVVFPDPYLEPVAAAAAPNPDLLSQKRRLLLGAMSTVVVFPVAGLFLATQNTDAILILIFIAILTLQPSLAAGYKAGAALILGNLVGGVASMIFYDLLVAIPQFGFMVLLTLLSALLFGSGLFSNSKWAPLFGMAFSTLLLIIGSTTSSFGDADAKASIRVIQITIAVVYAVVAFNALVSLLPRRES
jgi:Protein of unknown function (DUF2955)